MTKHSVAVCKQDTGKTVPRTMHWPGRGVGVGVVVGGFRRG